MIDKTPKYRTGDSPDDITEWLHEYTEYRLLIRRLRRHLPSQGKALAETPRLFTFSRFPVAFRVWKKRNILRKAFPCEGRQKRCISLREMFILSATHPSPSAPPSLTREGSCRDSAFVYIQSVSGGFPGVENEKHTT